ncbi:transposase [Catalinimonas alkaloidigena]|uniref:helix-turn-helix domain-containing protein n=1 Tax=Catalinimonas alkaloidigena TaxID=1075417 RepID=UPI0024053B27|nr:helix-turn-helix domain-containing protein [Catalinimonas alkaloidigena]MDF9798527.1 transposase [Catalinimonas alkaloidigena]
MFSADRDMVSRWLGQWEKEGLKRLRDQPRRGRPAKLRLDNPEHLQVVKKQIKISMSKFR